VLAVAFEREGVAWALPALHAIHAAGQRLQLSHHGGALAVPPQLEIENKLKTNCESGASYFDCKR
jgi:hypothetical protein